MEVLKPLRLRRYACALLLSTVCGVCAQEVKQEWTVSAKHPEIPTTTVGVFDNQHRAIEAMAQIAGPSDAEYAYRLATHVKETKTNEDQTVTLTYWLGNDQPSDPEWTYSALGSSYATEVEMAAGIESFYTQFNECGKVSLKPATEWTPYSAEFEGRIDSKRFDVIANVLYYDGTCLPVEHTGFGTRQRRLFCPLYTTWNDDYQACVNLEIFAYLTGPSLEDTCSVGNPCDVKTGEKSQPEQDFDLGWIRLVRTFRSSQVGRRSNLGAGWFNSHEISVSSNGSHAILAEGNGLQRNFESVGNSFIASDGSGDRLEKIANGWRLLGRKRFRNLMLQARWAWCRRTTVVIFDTRTIDPRGWNRLRTLPDASWFLTTLMAPVMPSLFELRWTESRWLLTLTLTLSRTARCWRA